MSTTKEICAKCIGSGEIVLKNKSRVCTLCGGKGITEEIVNDAFVNEHLFD